MLNKVTIVLLNCRRAENVDRLVRLYSEMDAVGGVIVWSTAPGDFRFDHPKVRTASCHQEWGMYPRYLMALMSETDAVLAVDDDLFLPEPTILALLEHWRAKPEVVHGLHGRGPNESGNYSAGPDGCWSGCSDAEVEIVCGRAALFHRCIVPFVFLELMNPKWPQVYAKAMELGVNPTQIEDMILSYCSLSRGGALNHVYRLPHDELPNPHAICSRANHYTYRNIGMKFCREYFKIEQPQP
jgi:hypothetical protein